MTIQTPITGADRDKAAFGDIIKAKNQDLLAHAAHSSGRSVMDINRDFSALSKGPGRLNLTEYVRYGLFDPTHRSHATRDQFISNEIHWPIAHKVNAQTWNAASEDKILAATILGAGGVPVAETVAVIDASPRLFPQIAKIHSAQALRDVVLAHLDTGLFGKVMGGMVSFGAFKIVHGDATHITCAGMEPMPYEQFLQEFVGANAYLLQKQLTNHAGIAPHATALATVRMVNFVTPEGIYSPAAVIKLPQGDNIADAYWRSGNIGCALDPETGTVQTVTRRNGLQIEFLDDHPDVPGLMGAVLPEWARLRKINEIAASLFAPIRYQSTDIAITQDGPVVVELNYGGGFDLPQNASGQGMLTPKVKALFESYGYAFDAAPKKKSGLSLFGRKG